MLQVGDKAPLFNGINQNNQTISLADFNGKKVVLYFYPKDNTPGCTAEACSLRDNYDSLLDQGFVVIGVSTDSVKSHLNFANKFNLPFHLIADTERIIADAYGVWVLKKMYGRESMGIQRKTFIIDANGCIEKIIEKVDTKNHALQILS